MPVAVSCPDCGRAGSVREEALGKRVKCGGCGGHFEAIASVEIDQNGPSIAEAQRGSDEEFAARRAAERHRESHEPCRKCGCTWPPALWSEADALGIVGALLGILGIPLTLLCAGIQFPQGGWQLGAIGFVFCYVFFHAGIARGVKPVWLCPNCGARR